MRIPLQILHLEDSKNDAELIALTLTEGGIQNKISCVESSTDFLAALEKGGLDLILSDYNLPAFDGLSALAMARKACPQIPFIFISGAIGEETAIETFKLGATDYVMKTRLSRLVPAVRRALREAEDKTEHERLEPALRESEEKFRQLAENVNAVFWLSDIGTNQMFYASPMYAKVFGRSCQSLYENPRSFLDAIHPDDRHLLITAIEDKKTQASFDVEYRVVRPDKTQRYLRARAYPVNDKEGKLYRICGIAEDITEQKQLEEQYRQSQKMDAIGKLAGGIAHDFNNLLTVINGYAEIVLIATAKENPAFLKIEQILKAGKRAAELTGQLLTFSRKQMTQPQVIDLNALVLDMDKMIRQMVTASVEFIFLPAKELSPVKVDLGQMHQVLLNLSANARDAMPKGGKLFIETANVILGEEYTLLHSHVKAGNYVMLAVTDTGSGMTPEIKEHIFEPFFTTKEQGKGTGLGLATCYGIVKQNGGSIEVYSEIGHGTIFKLYFPCVDKLAEPLPAIDEVRIDLSGVETILLAEDEESVRHLAEDVLTKNGYKVIMAENGQTAMQCIENHAAEIHLVLTDVVMPGISGRDLFDKIKLVRPGIGVLYMSGYTEEVVLRHEIQNNKANFLQKPFTVNSLLQKVRQVLDVKK